VNRAITALALLAAALLRLGVAVAETHAAPAEIHVGIGCDFTRIEDAVAAAAPGDKIIVHPLPDGAAYEKVALLIRKPNLTIEAADGLAPIKLSGVGYDYSGAGSIPRAIIQFDPDGDNCTFDGFEMFGASNQSGNGAGARINQADNVTIRNCEIYDCEMGIMSNGAGSGDAANQLIDTCVLHDNGSPGDGGYSHNLYLGGFSVRLQNCEVYASVTGHNVKSRAHITEVIDCYVHDSANREFDLVDNVDYTTLPGSNALIQGCTITKALAMDGNRGVIHFGQDGGNEHNGTIRIVDTVITTTYISPVVTLSAAGAGASIENSTILGGGIQQSNKTLFAVNNGALLSNITGFGLSIVEGYLGVTVDGVEGTGIEPPVTILPWD
jgi:hypothetical protein